MNEKRKSLLIFALTLVGVTVVLAHHAEVLDSNAGLQFGRSATESIGFHGATPSDQRTSASQTALTDNTGGSTADATLAVVTAPSALTDNTTGTASTTLASISDAATKNAVASLAARQAENRAAIVSLTNAVAKETKLLNELRAALVEKGLIKGS